ncbi:unnamed protein product [Acanthoscelides obtectus]|uniref:Uncharacterized protein n=1 Tax=Acanthoscelides obtectus TaxID=200917 RepID=A0A9P0LYU1_ACAOB|nr:unnamed protein product [Acanthoscelides obtectus]CAK1657836.1 hypothetical protein AOBTE_LOCUS20561 [Acanthoscelides obtectus]
MYIFFYRTTLNMPDKKILKTLDQLKHRELTLRLREEILNQREQKLAELEMKITLRAKMMEEMYHQAEIYLKHCHQYYKKQQQVMNRKTKPKPSYEDLDATYVSCGDSVVQETATTSKKLDVGSIMKPQNFTRTLSERRIRFKGHSPLKELDFNRKKLAPTGKLPRKSPNKVSKALGSGTSEGWVTCSEEGIEYVGDGSRQKGDETMGSKASNTRRSIIWTQEGTRRAFQLLKIMNNMQKENVQPRSRSTSLKHTQL